MSTTSELKRTISELKERLQQLERTQRNPGVNVQGTKAQLEERIRELEGELSDADERIEELETALTTVVEKAEEALPEEEQE